MPKAPHGKGDAARASFEDLLARVPHRTLDEFVAETKAPFLLRLGSGDAMAIARARSAVQTVHPTTPSGRRPTRPTHAYPVAKRPGANAFAFMITLGRTANNDIAIEDEAVSKFHASFANENGTWTIADRSRHGTWVDGQRLEAKSPTPLRSGALILLADAVPLRFYTPDELYAYLKTFRMLTERS
jgi:hypothetical protein